MIKVPAGVEKAIVLLVAIFASLSVGCMVLANEVSKYNTEFAMELGVISVMLGSVSFVIGAVWAQGINVFEEKMGEQTKDDIKQELAELKIKSASQEAIIKQCYKDIIMYSAEIDALKQKIAELEQEIADLSEPDPEEIETEE